MKLESERPGCKGIAFASKCYRELGSVGTEEVEEQTEEATQKGRTGTAAGCPGSGEKGAAQ